MQHFVDVPSNFENMFRAAEKFVEAYFAKRKYSPGYGIIEIDGERYILVRAKSMSVELFETVRRLFISSEHHKAFDIVKNLLFDIAHALGKSDAVFFHKKAKLKTPTEKLSAGPVHFAFSGWASVKILPESIIETGSNFVLYYEHPHSFESDSWLESGKKPSFPVCYMNAGYSSGWCSEAFGQYLVSFETSCRARGDDRCRFVMAPPDQIHRYVKDELSEKLTTDPYVTQYNIPGFFKRKAIEALLEKSESKYRMLFSYANDAIFVLEHDKIIDVNPMGISSVGRTKDVILNSRFLDMAPRFQSNGHSSSSLWAEYFKEAVSGKSMVFEWQFTRPDGSLVDTEIALNIIDPDYHLFQAIIRNITQRKKLTSQQIQAQKMEAIGTLASGVAHDFNNILAGMLGFTSLLKLRLPKSDVNCQYLERLENAIQQAADLTKQLLTFSKRSKPRTVSLDINTTIENVIHLLKSSIKHAISLNIELSESLDPIYGDPNQLEQMVMNLIINASQALPSGGTITIRSRTPSPQELSAENILPLTENYWVVLEIIDNGIGMSESTLNRIFEPYFSMRENGKGIGLGMSIVYNIVNNHQGQIRIQSREAQGTHVKVFLPFSKQSPLPYLGHSSELIPGTETILIVDDEKIIRDLLSELLNSLGYKILIAHDGYEALQIADRHDLELAIINMGLPKMDGRETFKELKIKHSGIYVILMSGMDFSETEQIELKAEGVSFCLKKPFTLGELCRCIRTLFDSRKS
ncbi:response regulator [bacterium]|nr:response regulator [candidate division CSSED10-310 bacterium]